MAMVEETHAANNILLDDIWIVAAAIYAIIINSQ